MAMTPTAVAGDVGDTITVRLDGIDTLNASSVRAIVRRPGTTTSHVLTATITDANERTVTISLGDADGWLATDATVGTWDLEIEATFANGDVLTWPSAQPMRLAVRSDLD